MKSNKYLTDQDIKNNVKDQLTSDYLLDDKNINIEVKNGNVTLSGNVPTFHSRQKAKDDAYSVNGVHKVIDELEINNPTETPQLSDKAIKESIENRLKYDPDLNIQSLSVKVVEGKATISGVVESYAEQLLATDVAFEIYGVLSVENNLAIVRTDKFTDDWIAEDISGSLKRSILDTDKIDVEVENGVVTITGRVEDAKEWNTLLKIAKNTAGVIKVIDETTVMN